MKYHHVYARTTKDGAGNPAWDGACDDCAFETNAYEQDAKTALAECLRSHPQPPIVVFAHEHTRGSHDTTGTDA